MAIATEQVAEKFLSISAGVPLNCNWPLYAEDEVVVLYGKSSLVAVLNTDYNVTLSAPDYNTFTITPLASLITKINNLIAADGTETNFCTVRRVLDYLTSVEPETVRFTGFLSREIERIHMRLQQLDEANNRLIGLSPTEVGDSDNAIYIKRPVAGKVVIGNTAGDGFDNGPDVASIDASVAAATAAKVAAENARDATLASFDSFDDRYLGAKTSDPSTDNDGNALVAGTLYYRTTGSPGMKIYTGSAWVDAYVDGTGVLQKANNLSDLTNVSTARTNLGASAVGASVFTAANALAARTAIGANDEYIAFAISDEVTAITAGTNKIKYEVQRPFTLTAVGASLSTASSSGLVTFDINKNGTTVLSTKLTVDANETSSRTAATAAVISVSSFVAGDEIEIDVDSAGTGAKGAKIYLKGTLT